jgi:hypothetical protein
MQTKQQIDSQLVGELYAAACQLCSTAGIVEAVWFKESPSAMKQSIVELREVLDQFSVILYSKTYTEKMNEH